MALGLALRCTAPLAWATGAAYWFGMMSHPIQGWMVNSLAHRYGYRNFASADQSRNHPLVAWLVMGEGYQNNHHEAPTSPKFSVRWFEFDSGYLLCLIAERLNWLTVKRPLPAEADFRINAETRHYPNPRRRNKRARDSYRRGVSYLREKGRQTDPGPQIE